MNEKEVTELIRKAGGGKSYYPPRVVGKRIEVHFCGDYEPTIIEMEPRERQRDLRPLTLAEVPSASKLQKQRVDYLRKMAANMGIDTKGLKKADLIDAIVLELEGQSSEIGEFKNKALNQQNSKNRVLHKNGDL